MAPAKPRPPDGDRPSLEGFPTDLRGAGKDDVLALTRRFGVDFLRLQFTDILGINKNVEVPRSQFEKALDGEIMFDGSSIEGFVRIEESDMLLKPDLDTFRILPYDDEGGRVARLLCDIYTPDEEPFAGCPRMTLKRQVERARKLGFSMMAGCEAEFFLFEKVGGRQSQHHHPRCGLLLRPRSAGQGRGDPPGDRGAPGGDGLRGGGGAPRGGRWPARDRSALCRRADHGRQPDHLQVRGAERGQPVRLRGVVHAQADRRCQRQRNAHPPVAVSGQGERLPRSEGAQRPLQDRAELHRGSAPARPRLLRRDQSTDQQLQAPGSGL